MNLKAVVCEDVCGCVCAFSVHMFQPRVELFLHKRRAKAALVSKTLHEICVMKEAYCVCVCACDWSKKQGIKEGKEIEENTRSKS